MFVLQKFLPYCFDFARYRLTKIHKLTSIFIPRLGGQSVQEEEEKKGGVSIFLLYCTSDLHFDWLDGNGGVSDGLTLLHIVVR